MVNFGSVTISDSTPTPATPVPAVVPVAIAQGDGIGPEIMGAVLRIMDAAGARLRYDTIDLDDGNANPGATPTSSFLVDGVLGGQMDAFTLGVNWYWRSNFKFMANYVKVDSSRFFGRTPAFPYADNPADNNVLVNREIDDSPNIFELRMQFYF